MEGDDGRHCWICFLKRTKQLSLRSQLLLVFVLLEKGLESGMEERRLQMKQESSIEEMMWNGKEKEAPRLQEKKRPGKEERKWKE